MSLGVLRALVATVPGMLLSMPDAPYEVEVVSPVLYGQVPGQPVWEGGLYLDLLLPTPPPSTPAPAVIYLHHGGWLSGDRSYGMYPWHGPLLAAYGFVVGCASYRFSSVAPFPAQLHDAKAAIRWLRANAATLGVDPDRIGAWGDSAGGHLAALLATTADRTDLEGNCGSPGSSSKVQAATIRSAPTDFRSYLPDPWAAEILDTLFDGPPSDTAVLRELASPVVHVTATSAPFLIVHGTQDETVPFAQAQLMTDRLTDHGVDVTLHAIDGVHHNLQTNIDTPWGSTPWTELGHQALDFFHRALA